MDGKRTSTTAACSIENVVESEERFRAVCLHSPDPISEIGQDRRLLWVSPGFTRVFGWKSEEVVGRDVMRNVHPDDLDRLRGIHSNAEVGEPVEGVCFRYRHRNGSWRWVELTGCPYRTSSGEIRAILINRDVTDRLNTQAALEEQLAAETRVEELSRYFLTIGTDDFESGIEHGLRAASDLAGADRAQFFVFDLDSGQLGKCFQWFTPEAGPGNPDFDPESSQKYQWSRGMLVRGEPVVAGDVSEMPEAAAAERRSLMAAGVRSYLAIPVVHGDITIGFLDFACLARQRSWSLQEISRLSLLADVFASALRRHRAEARRRQTEIRFQTLAEHTTDSICEITLDGRILYASPSLCDIIGYGPEELDLVEVTELIHPDDLDLIQPENLEELVARHGTATVRSKVRHRDGGWRWIEASVRPFRTESGEERFAAVIRDVTRRQQAQQDLEQQLVLERRLTELSREFLDRGPGEIDLGIRQALAAAGRLGGSERCWLVTGDARDQPTSFEWCAEGIAPRPFRFGFEDRRKHSWIFRQLLSGEPVMIPRSADLPDEAAGVREHMLADGVRSFLAIPIRSEESMIGVLGFHSIRREKHWTDHEINLFRLIAGMFAGALRRRRAEAELRESEERFRALAEHAKDPICEIDDAGVILFASPSFTNLLGYERSEFRRLNFFELMHPDDLETLSSQYAALDSTQRLRGTLLYRARHKNGDWVVLEATAQGFDGASGENRIVAVVRDVTERQRAQQALERQLDLETRIAVLSRRFLGVATGEIDRTIRESLADLAALAESDRSWLISVEPGASSIRDVFEWHAPGVPFSVEELLEVDSSGFRWSAQQMLSGHVCHFPDTHNLPQEAEHERESLVRRNVRSFLGIPLHSGNQPVSILGFETLTRQKTWSTETITLLRLVGEIFVSALQRKTIEENLRESQQQLMQAQKMEAVGTLAGGIAHDFNNQLTVMLGNARYVMRQVEDDPEIKDALTDLNRAAEHCAQLTRSLLAFSRRSTVAPCSLAIGQVVGQVEELLRPLIPSSIEFVIACPVEEASIEADPTQIQQVLVNLAINARDAMPEGGRLDITAATVRLDMLEASRMGLPRPGEYVDVSVTDTGTGIDPDTQKRIFEPFFTTKPLGRGTGLGLATAYGIVTECRGMILVDSEVGVGTSFRVLLPRSSDTLEVKLTDEPLPDARDSGTVLVVEEDESILGFVRATLTRSGFRVHEAPNGIAALRLLAVEGPEFDAVITGVNMPDMNGFELVRRLNESHPGTPVLFLSGATPLPTDGRPGAAAFLQKPFGEEELLSAVRRVLSTDGGR